MIQINGIVKNDTIAPANKITLATTRIPRLF